MNFFRFYSCCEFLFHCEFFLGFIPVVSFYSPVKNIHVSFIPVNFLGFIPLVSFYSLWSFIPVIFFRFYSTCEFFIPCGVLFPVNFFRFYSSCEFLFPCEKYSCEFYSL